MQRDIQFLIDILDSAKLAIQYVSGKTKVSELQKIVPVKEQN